MNATVRTIQVGVAPDGRPAVTLTLDNDTHQTIIFSLETAKTLSWGLAGLCERLTTLQPFSDSTGVADGCSVSLQPPKED